MLLLDLCVFSYRDFKWMYTSHTGIYSMVSKIKAACCAAADPDTFFFFVAVQALVKCFKMTFCLSSMNRFWGSAILVLNKGLRGLKRRTSV